VTAPRSGAAPTPAPAQTVEFTITGPAISLHAPECTSGCALPYTQVGSVTGSLTGTLTGAGAVQLRGSRYTGATTFVFHGHVEGCGRGTATLRRREAGDLETHTVLGVWDIVAGFGSGTLDTLTGHGTIGAPPGDPGAGKIASTLKGQVACHGSQPASEAPTTTPGAFAVRFEGTTPAPPVAAPTCDHDGHCVYPTVQHTIYRGSIDGTENAAGVGSVKPLANSFAYAATTVAAITGSIKRCGRGTMIMRSESVFDGRKLTFTWEIATGFGAGRLANIRGSGTGHGVRGADGTYVSTFTGNIAC
jgi:hypothetical protein